MMSQRSQAVEPAIEQTVDSDQAVVAALRAGDETVFAALVDRHHASLVRLAMLYVGDRAVAEEVAQETWLGLLKGIDGFAGRSSLRTWLFRILTNQAKRHGMREGRSIPFSAIAPIGFEAAVEPERFFPPGHEYAGHWRADLPDLATSPEAALLSGETRAVIDRAIADLPPAQRAVITLRDIEGWPSDDVCNELGLSGTNQRVLLHRARSKVRREIERQGEGEGEGTGP